jgi:hypothetical protein
MRRENEQEEERGLGEERRMRRRGVLTTARHYSYSR